MVNASLNWASFVGIALAVAGAGLYALRSLRPAIARDHDIFFAAIALLCGGILIFQGWRLDPILQFNQFLLAGSAIFFAFETVRLRGATTEQAKRNTPIVDDERPVSRVYRAELDELGALEDRTTTRRIRGTRDGRPARDEYEDEVRRRPANRPNGGSRRRPRPDVGPMDAPSDTPDVMADSSSRRGPRRGPAPSATGNDAPDRYRPRRSRPSQDAAPSARMDDDSPYVDYRPIDDEDNWGEY